MSANINSTPGHDPVAAGSVALRALSRLNGWVCSAAIGLSAAMLLISLCLIGWAVCMRYLLNRPPVWTDEAVGFLLVAIVMLAAAQVLRRGEHIGVDIVVEHLKGSASRWAHGFASFAALLVAVILVFNGWETAMQSKSFGIVTEGRLELPVWWLMLLLPLGGALMGLVALEALWRQVLGLPLPPVPAHVLPADLDPE